MVDSAWLTPTVVRQSVGLRPGTPVDDAALLLAANAAAAYVEDLPAWKALDPAPSTAGEAPATLLLGAAMLAHRWYARRGSPLGVTGYAELGAAGILRYDPDIARLLGIGSDGGAFVFGAPTTPAAVPPEVVP